MLLVCVDPTMIRHMLVMYILICKTKYSNCLYKNLAVTAFWICTAVLLTIYNDGTDYKLYNTSHANLEL